MKDLVLKFLREYENNFVSGEEISQSLGVSRTAIWKYINALKKEGYKIESISKKGYRLLGSPDILNLEEIKQFLNTKYIGRNVLYMDSVNSTNEKAKVMAQNQAAEGTVVISEEQTEGKGRMGRNWVSPKFKGIWMSIILTPEMEPINVSKITILGAAAVYKALEGLNIKTLIKWPNDIVLNNKKLCGILTEMSCELNKVNYIVMGIGVNVNLEEEDFTEEIKDKATSTLIETGRSIERKQLLANILNHFEGFYEEFIREGHIDSAIEICRSNSVLLGKEIQIVNRNSTKIVKAVDINNEGMLVVQNEEGFIENIISGEVSARGLYGYV